MSTVRGPLLGVILTVAHLYIYIYIYISFTHMAAVCKIPVRRMGRS